MEEGEEEGEEEEISDGEGWEEGEGGGVVDDVYL